MVPLAERGRVNAFMRGGYLLGWAVGGAVLAYVLHHGGFQPAALVQSLTLLVLTALTFFIKLDRADRLLPTFGKAGRAAARAHAAALNDDEENPSLRWLFAELWRSIMERYSLRAFSIIFLAYLASYLFSNAYNYHLIHTLKWADADVSIMQGSWGSVAAFGLLLGGGVLVDRLGTARLQYWVMAGYAFFLLVFGALAPFWHVRALGFTGLVLMNVADPLLSVAAMPALMGFCRPKIEGSQFTTYMALVNLCGVASSYLNGYLLEITTAPIIGLVCGGLMMGLVVAQRRLRPRPQLVQA